MSFVTTARLYFGHNRRLSRSTSAVLPEPTGPATPTRNARCSDVVDIFLHPAISQDVERPLQRWSLPACPRKDCSSRLRLLVCFRFVQSKFPFAPCLPCILSTGSAI